MTNYAKGFFITGTDTNVGKTLTAILLARQLGAYYWKPIQSGTPPVVPFTDSQFVARFIGKERVLKEAYLLSQPLSPNQSAALESRKINFDALKLPPSSFTPLLVESAGGIMVPINENKNMLDLMKKFTLPIIVVARSGLGTLNHSLLTLRELERQGLTVQGLILVGPAHPRNRTDLKRISGIPILGEIDLNPFQKIGETWFRERESCLEKLKALS